MAAAKPIIRYRRMTIDDVQAVHAIEEEAFADPWTEEAFLTELVTNLYSYYVVAEAEGYGIVGYAGMWMVIDESHITNVAVQKRWQGQKIGEGLMREAIRVAREQQIVLMTLEVRISNQIAQNLYRKLGFQDGGLRKRYYSDNYEDALVMWVEWK